MRSVELRGYDFIVTDDPDGILGDFLALAVCDPDASSDDLLAMLDPATEGYSVPDETGAFPLEVSEDIPESLRMSGITALPEGEPWVVWRDRRGRGSLNMLVSGDELRELFRRASTFWKARPR